MDLYERLTSVEGPCDIASAVSDTQRLLRNMSRETAAGRLAVMRSPVATAIDFERDVAVARLRGGDSFPFQHPYEWASFHVLGRGAVELGIRRAGQ